jgi:hypothetical protein
LFSTPSTQRGRGLPTRHALRPAASGHVVSRWTFGEKDASTRSNLANSTQSLRVATATGRSVPRASGQVHWEALEVARSTRFTRNPEHNVIRAAEHGRMQCRCTLFPRLSQRLLPSHWGWLGGPQWLFSVENSTPSAAPDSGPWFRPINQQGVPSDSAPSVKGLASAGPSPDCLLTPTRRRARAVSAGPTRVPCVSRTTRPPSPMARQFAERPAGDAAPEAEGRRRCV